MKNYIKSIMTAALMLVATGTWADNVTVITQVNGQASTAGGTATVDNPYATGNEVVTITVTPGTGYYLEDITAIKTISGSYAQTRAPGIDEPLTLTKTKGDAEDGVSTYTFVMPADVDGKSYGAEITVNFMPKKDPEVTAPKAITGLVYNTALQNLITAGSTTGGTMKYSLDGTEYATAIPQGKDAKDYTVYYKVEGNGTYNDVAAKSITVTINAKEVKNPTINLSETSFEYDGEEHKPTVTVYDGTTEIPASEYNVAYQKKASDSGDSGSGESGTSANGSGTSTEISGVDGSSVSDETKEPGTYIVVISDKMGGNYKISNATAEFEITPKQTIWLMIQEVNPKTFTYDGNPHSPQLRIGAATEKNCSAKFVLPDTEYTIEYKYNNTKVEECIAPGAYTMVVMPKAGSQYTFDPTTAEFEILESDVKIDPAVTAPTPIENLVYNGNNQQLFNPGSTTGGTMKYSIDRVTYPDGTVKVLTGYNVYSTFSKFTHSLKDVGTYLIYYKVEGNEYYNDVAAKSFTVTISQAPLTVQTGSASKTYDGECLTSSEASITGLVNGETATVTATGSQTNVGESENTFEIKWGDTKSSNYTISENLGTLTVETKIVKNPTINLSPTSFEYDGQEHKPTVTVYDGTTEIPASEYNVSYQKKTSNSGSTGEGEIGTSAIETETSTDIGSASVETKEADTYIVTITDKKGGNYSIGTASAEYEIVDNSLTEPTAKTNLVYNGKAQALIVPPSSSGIEFEYLIFSYYKSMDDYNTALKTSGEDGRGDTGLTGITGAAGAKGDTGKTGAAGDKGKGEQEEITYPTEWSTNIPEGKNAGVYLIVYRNKSNQNNPVNFPVEIAPKKMGGESISLKETTLTYTGRALEPEVTVSGVEINGKKEILTRDKDYTITYLKDRDPVTECVDVGRYSLMVTGIEGSNYKIVAMAEFEIVEDENIDVVVPPTPIEGLVYNGQPQALVKAGSVSKLREMQYRLSSENAWSTEIPVATNAGEYEVEYWAQAINALAKDLTSGYVKVTIAPKELKEENFFISNSGGKMSNGPMNPYPAVDSVKVILIEGHQPIKLQKGTDYTFDYFGADNQWIAEDELYMDKNQNMSINLVVTGKGNYSGEVRRSFTNTLVISSFNELTNTATITGLANSEATTVVIPATVAVNGKIYSVTSISSGVSKIKNLTIDLTNFTRKKLQENPLEIEGGALEGNKVKVLPETLAFFASNPSLKDNVENGQLYADLKADYYLQTFSCGIDITIPIKKEITYVVGKDIVNLGTIRDITEYLKFYKCTVKENDGKDEVFVSSIHDQMKDGFRRKTSGGGSGGGSTVLATSLLYEANNGVLIACDTTSVINLIEQVDVASIADQVDLKSLATALGYGALVKYAPEAMLKQYVLNNSDLVKKKIKEQFRSTAATLVAQYTKDKPIANGDAKTYGQDNMLVPVTESSHFDATDEAGNTYYILYNGTFHKINDNIKTEVSACKAVLKVPGSLAKSRTLDITEGDDDTTVISAILAEGDGEARWYNLSGQRIEKPTKKGLYILNGHKVVIK